MQTLELWIEEKIAYCCFVRIKPAVLDWFLIRSRFDLSLPWSISSFFWVPPTSYCLCWHYCLCIDELVIDIGAVNQNLRLTEMAVLQPFLANFPPCKYINIFHNIWSSMGIYTDNGHPERASFKKFESFGLGQTNWAEILGCILVISSQILALFWHRESLVHRKVYLDIFPTKNVGFYV